MASHSSGKLQPWMISTQANLVIRILGSRCYCLCNLGETPKDSYFLNSLKHVSFLISWVLINFLPGWSASIQRKMLHYSLQLFAQSLVGRSTAACITGQTCKEHISAVRTTSNWLSFCTSLWVRWKSSYKCSYKNWKLFCFLFCKGTYKM